MEGKGRFVKTNLCGKSDYLKHDLHAVRIVLLIVFFP